MLMFSKKNVYVLGTDQLGVQEKPDYFVDPNNF